MLVLGSGNIGTKACCTAANELSSYVSCSYACFDAVLIELH